MQNHLPTAADAPLNERLALPADFTDADLAFLSPAEIKNLRDEGFLDPMLEPGADPAPKAEVPATTAPEIIDPDAAAKDGEKPADQAAPPAAAPPPPADDFDTSALRAIPDTAAAKAAMEKADADLKILHQQFNDLDVTDDEYSVKLNEIINSKAEAVATLRGAEGVAEANAAAVRDHWFKTVDSYMAANPALKGENTLPLFDAALREINSNAQNLTLPAKTRIAMAHMRVASMQPGMTVPASAEPPKAQDPARKPASAALDGPRSDGRPAPIQTLAGAPAAAENDVSNGRFGAIDNTADPYEAEAALSRLSPSEQAAYLRGA